jgi:uncharacterized lipoprotein YmbA
MNMRNRITCLLIAAGMSAVFGGCFGTSPGSRFYTLSQGGSRGISVEHGLDMVVRVGPVSIASYIDRQQIVTRNGRNGIEISEFERWGGSLDEEISRLLVNDLSQRLADRGIAVAPWRSIALADVPAVYRIPISIDRFDGVLGETVVLNASWAVILKKDKQEKVLIARESTIREAAAGKGYDELVAAMGKAVERLGKEMADSLATAVEAKKPT